MTVLHSIELLESEHDGFFDIRVDGYVHKLHKHLTEEAANQCIASLRTYYANIGDLCRVTRPAVIV